MVEVVHPTISLEEYDGLMLDYGWEAPFERLGGEVIVVAPIGAETEQVGSRTGSEPAGFRAGR